MWFLMFDLHSITVSIGHTGAAMGWTGYNKGCCIQVSAVAFELTIGVAKGANCLSWKQSFYFILIIVSLLHCLVIILNV